MSEATMRVVDGTVTITDGTVTDVEFVSCDIRLGVNATLSGSTLDAGCVISTAPAPAEPVVDVVEPEIVVPAGGARELLIDAPPVPA